MMMAHPGSAHRKRGSCGKSCPARALSGQKGTSPADSITNSRVASRSGSAPNVMAIAGLANLLRRWVREVVGVYVQPAIGELGDCRLAVVPPYGSQPRGRPTRFEPDSSVGPVERDAGLEVAERIDACCPRTESRAASRACHCDSRRGASARDREGSLVRRLDRRPISARGRICQCATSTGRARPQGRSRTPPKVARPAPSLGI